MKKLCEIYAPAFGGYGYATNDEFLFIFQKYFGTAIE
jgi:hypothetical protein